MLSSAIPYTLELEALRRMPASVFGVLMSLEPAAAALAGFIVLGEDLVAREIVAIGLVVTASAGAARGARVPRATPDSGTRLRRRCRPGVLQACPAPATRRRDLEGLRRRWAYASAGGASSWLSAGSPVMAGRSGEEVEHAERLPAPVAPGDAREPIEVDHVFAMGAEIVGHVHYCRLDRPIVQSGRDPIDE